MLSFLPFIRKKHTVNTLWCHLSILKSMELWVPSNGIMFIQGFIQADWKVPRLKWMTHTYTQATWHIIKQISLFLEERRLKTQRHLSGKFMYQKLLRNQRFILGLTLKSSNHFNFSYNNTGCKLLHNMLQT